MAETIPGGAYKGTDGTWHDANGKPLPAHIVRQLENQRPESGASKEKETGAPAQPPEPDGVTTVTPAENEAAPAAGDEKPAGTRRSRRS